MGPPSWAETRSVNHLRQFHTPGDLGCRSPSADADAPFSDPIVIQGPIEAIAQAVAKVGVTALFASHPAGGRLAGAAVPARQRSAAPAAQVACLCSAFLGAYILLDMIGLQPPELVDALVEMLTFGALYVGVVMAVLR
jgi:hypothetical protein